MDTDIKNYIEKGKKYLNDAMEHLNKELLKVRTGKASPMILEGILVEYYGNPTPLNQVANISLSDARTLVIQPWEKSIIAEIERAIFAANLGLTPQNDGEMIRISIPPLTEDRRKDLVKQAKHLGEECKISIRNARHKMMDFIKKAVKDGYSEDEGKRREDEVQKLINEYGQKVDQLITAKEKDIMTV